MSAAELKEQGNRLFAARQYEDAVGCYSKAIVSLKTATRSNCQKSESFIFSLNLEGEKRVMRLWSMVGA